MNRNRLSPIRQPRYWISLARWVLLKEGYQEVQKMGLKYLRPGRFSVSRGKTVISWVEPGGEDNPPEK